MGPDPYQTHIKTIPDPYQGAWENLANVNGWWSL